MTPSLSAPGTFYALWQLPEHYLLMAPDYTILDASDLYLAATLKQREAIVGRNVFDVFPRDEQNDWQVFSDSLEHVRQHAHAPHHAPHPLRHAAPRRAGRRPGGAVLGNHQLPAARRRRASCRPSCSKPRT